MKKHEESQEQVLRKHHIQYLWAFWLVVILGIWMIISSLTFDYAKGAVNPSGGREVWLSLNGRIFACMLSDVISGFLLLIFGFIIVGLAFFKGSKKEQYGIWEHIL